MEEKKNITIRIYEVLGGANAITSADGEIVFERISKAFENDLGVTLDYDNIELIVSTFLNASVGQLYGSYSDEFIKNHLEVKNLTEPDVSLLKKVVQRAKGYFQNRKKMDESISNILEDDPEPDEL